MKFFTSSQSEQKQASAPEIPAEIQSVVYIMGDQPKGAPVSPAGDEKVAPAPRAGSPFLGGDSYQPAAASQAPVAAAPSGDVPPASDSSSFRPELKPLFGNVAGKRRGAKGMWVIALLGVSALAIALGAWWYIVKSSPEDQSLEVASPDAELPPPAAVAAIKFPDPGTQFFSLDTPNYLSIDIETITPAGLRGVLKPLSEKIRFSAPDQPVEFLLTDKNNNPIAFSRFAYLMNIELDPELLSAIGESFSLFLHNDQGRAALGLGLTLPDEAARALVSPQEDASFPYAFRSLFFEGLSVPKEAVFRSGVYNTQSVRFVNIDAAQNISFDYAVRGNDWFIGTSKDTLRAILDK